MNAFSAKPRAPRFLIRGALVLLIVACTDGGGAAPAQAQAALRPLTTPVKQLTHSALAWGDYNADGAFDLIVSGAQSSTFRDIPVTILYKNEGDTMYFTPKGLPVYKTLYQNSSAQIEAVDRGAAAWNDYDNDGKLDLAVMGRSEEHEPITSIYRRTNGRFRRAVRLPSGLQDGDLAWGDYDNDGDADLLVTGAGEENQPRSLLYENQDGFFIMRNTGLAGLVYSSADWGDYDTDGDLDLVMTGVTEAEEFATKVYQNDGDGTFTEQQAGLWGTAFGTVDWGDYDADGDPDLLLSGGVLSPFMLRGVVKVYKNENGSFVDQHVALEGGYHGGASWGDYDGDGLLDVMVSGGSVPVRSKTGAIYLNEGNGTFTRSEDITGVIFGDAAFADYDNDNDMDVVVGGRQSTDTSVTRAFRNERETGNTPPSAPSGLRASVSGRTATLSWEAATDAQTPDAGLSYNLRLGTAPGRADVMAALAAPDSGYRYVAGPGNAGQNTRWTVRGLPPGTYYWSVQAIDNSYKGSPFAAEQSFDAGDSARAGPPSAPTGRTTRARSQ